MLERPTAVARLRRSVEKTGYYPELVMDTLQTAFGNEQPVSHVVQHETHFSGEELRRHVTVLAMTRSRLIVCHSDEYPPDPDHDNPYAAASTESVPLSTITSVVVTRTVSEPSSYERDAAVTEAMLSVGWGGVARIDVEPATCGDPQCEADHGYTGTLTSDDLTMRLSDTADGPGSTTALLGFARALSEATSTPPHPSPSSRPLPPDGGAAG
jgi:hypothetical protein